jgi:hypothetical protein
MRAKIKPPITEKEEKKKNLRPYQLFDAPSSLIL